MLRSERSVGFGNNYSEAEHLPSRIALAISVYCECEKLGIQHTPLNMGDSVKHKTSLSAIAALLAMLMIVGCNGGDKTASTDGGTTPTTNGTETAGGRKAPTGAGNEATGDTIKIGLVASVSGDNKPWGDDSWEGAKMAVDEANAAGGVNGKKIELLMEDSASKQEQA